MSGGPQIKPRSDYKKEAQYIQRACDAVKVDKNAADRMRQAMLLALDMAFYGFVTNLDDDEASTARMKKCARGILKILEPEEGADRA